MYGMQRHVAERVEIGVQAAIAKREASNVNMNIETMVRDQFDRLELRLRASVYAMSRQRVEVHRQWPRDWWEAVKERWAPKWFLGRYPVVYDRVDVSQQIYGPVCPHVHVRENQRHFEFLVMSNEDAENETRRFEDSVHPRERAWGAEQEQGPQLRRDQARPDWDRGPDRWTRPRPE